MRNLTDKKRDPQVVEAEKRAGIKHVEFCVRLYLEQLMGGRFFIHEHPHEAKSWGLKCITELLSREGVDTVVVDMCSYGLTSVADGVEGPARKRTKIMSNSVEVLRTN